MNEIMYIMKTPKIDNESMEMILKTNNVPKQYWPQKKMTITMDKSYA